MAYSFDSLGYADRLRERGVPNDQAEAYAEAARKLPDARTRNRGARIGDQDRFTGDGAAASIRVSCRYLQTELRTSVTELRTNNDTLALRHTVRFGTMVVVAIGALATILTILKLS